MGFLKIFGKALEWEESKQHFEKIKKDIVLKLIDMVKSTEGVTAQPKFGYEVNFFIKFRLNFTKFQ